MIVNSGDFSGDAVVKTPCFHCRGHRFNPWSGTKIPHAVQHCEKINILLKLFFFLRKELILPSIFKVLYDMPMTDGHSLTPHFNKIY